MEIISFNISKKLKRTKNLLILSLNIIHSPRGFDQRYVTIRSYAHPACVSSIRTSYFLVSLTANYYASHYDSTYAYLSPLCRSRRRFHVSSRRRSERSIRQFQQTRPSRRLQKVLHMFGRYRERVRMPYRHCVQDR